MKGLVLLKLVLCIEDTCEGAVVVGDDEKVIMASTLSASSSRVRERATKEFLKTMGVAGDELHPSRVAFAELKKGLIQWHETRHCCW